MQYKNFVQYSIASFPNFEPPKQESASGTWKMGCIGSKSAMDSETRSSRSQKHGSVLAGTGGAIFNGDAVVGDCGGGGSGAGCDGGC